MADMPPISDEYAAELVSKLEASTQLQAAADWGHADPRDLLILKLWAKVQALEAGTAFVTGIKPVGRSPQ